MRGTTDKYGLVEALLRFPTDERDHWRNEIMRLAEIVEAYGAIRRKRRFVSELGSYTFPK